MNKSDSTEKISKALAIAQSEIKNAVKDSVNPFFRSSFASLESVLKACLPAFNKNEVFVSQQTEVVGDKVVLNTTLYHSSGQWISSSYPIHPTKNDPQAMGSAISYARRYSLEAIASMGSSDTDAEAAMERVRPTQTTQPEPTSTKTEASQQGTEPNKPSKAQLKRLFAIMHSARWNEEGVKELMISRAGKSSTRDLTLREYDDVCKFMVANPVS